MAEATTEKLTNMASPSTRPSPTEAEGAKPPAAEGKGKAKPRRDVFKAEIADDAAAAVEGAPATESTTAPADGGTEVAADGQELKGKAPEKPAPGSAEGKEPAVATEQEAAREVAKISDAWEKITAKDAQITRREKDLKQREAKLQESQTGQAELQSLARSNPVALLEKFGVSLADVVEFIQNDGKPTEAMKTKDLDDKLSKLEKQLADEKTAAAQARELAEHEANVAQALSEIRTKVDKSDKFPHIQANEAYRDVLDLIFLYHQENGIVLSDEDAAESVEEHYRSKYEAASAKLKSPAIPAPDSGDPQPEEEEEVPAGAKKPAAPRKAGTLANKMQGTAPAKIDRSKLSDEESKKLAASKLKWD